MTRLRRCSRALSARRPMSHRRFARQEADPAQACALSDRLAGAAGDATAISIDNRPNMASKFDIPTLTGHIWPMNFTLHDQMTDLGKRIKARRLVLDLTQQAAAAKAGVAHRTWRRLEAEGKASIEALVRAAIVLRCDAGIAELFPEMAASSMDELLAQQRKASRPLRQRAGSARS